MKFHRSAALTTISAAICLACAQSALGAPTHYASPDGGHNAPYANWGDSATNIQDAVDAATSGGLVLISNGVYITTSQVDVTNSITVQGFSGDPTDVTISNSQVNSRALYVSNSTALVSGLGLTGGDFPSSNVGGGGGVLLRDGTVSNCLMFNNESYNMGASARVEGGLLTHCTLTSGTTHPSAGTAAGARMLAGTMAYCTVTNNQMPGGAVRVDGGTLRYCDILDNGTGGSGGGVYLQESTTGAATSRVEHCTIAGNTAARGGGVYVAASSGISDPTFAILENCIITNNSAISTGTGGGVYYTIHNWGAAVIRNCLIAGNSANADGGGMYLTFTATAGIEGGADNCTIVGNSANGNGQGLYFNWPSALDARNFIVYHNGTGDQVEYIQGDLVYSCMTPLVAGTGNTSSDPEFTDKDGGDYALLAGSPCIDTGTNDTSWMTGAKDLDGVNDRIVGGTVDMGAYEADPNSGPLTCNFSAPTVSGFAPLQVIFTASVAGDPSVTSITTYAWTFGDGNTEIGATKRVVTNTYTTAGSYDVTLVVTNTLSQEATQSKTAYITVAPLTNYVSKAGAHVAPYESWANAATTIQAAVDSALAGTTSTLVLVTSDTYNVTAEITILKDITVTSVGGPDETFIDAGFVSGRRCMRMTSSGALLSGFTLKRGRNNSSGSPGGALYLIDGTVSNCIFTANRAYHGAGVQMDAGLVTHSTFIANTNHQVSASQGTGLRVSLAGTGARINSCVFTNNKVAQGTIWLSSGTASNCTVVDNTGTTGPGFYVLGGATVQSCLASGNQGSGNGGGMYVTTGNLTANLFYNTITGNSGVHGGGIYSTAGNSGLTHMRNNLVANNVASGNGGGIYTIGSSSGGLTKNFIESCTMSSNTAAVGGGLYRAVAAIPALDRYYASNSIVYFNSAPSSNDIFNTVGGVAYSCSPDVTDGVDGNTTDDPLFEDLIGGDFRLKFGSPAINTGSNQTWMVGAVDLAGKDRIIEDVVDMGAYESDAPGPQGTVIYVR